MTPWPEQIRTDRLLLRVPRLDDAQAIFEEYASDPEVTRYLLWPPYQAVEDLEAFLKSCLDRGPQTKSLPWAITLPPSDRVVGMIAVHPQTTFKVDVGYVLARRLWGQGIMTEALRAVIGVALARPEIYRVAAACDLDNPASARVMEKAGMSREGILRRYGVHPNVSNEPRDVVFYSVVR
jgi:RimJ/RimL family protein N-acetyltransferase